MVPVFRNLSEEEYHLVKLQTLTDILRPIAVPELIYAFLLHIDLVANESLTEEDGENGVFSVISDPVLIAVSRHCLDDAAGTGAGFPEHVTAEKKSRILAKMSRRLNQCQDPQVFELVERMFKIGVITLEEMHPLLKERILSLKFMAQYLLDPFKFLRAFDGTTTAEQFEQRGTTLSRIIPYLIERQKYNEAADMITLFSGYVREDSWRSTNALRLLLRLQAHPRRCSVEVI